MKVRYTLPALADLEAILDYVTERSPRGARRIMTRIQGAERLLAQHPLFGAQTRSLWLRRLKTSFYPDLISCEVADSDAIIHAVRQRARPVLDARFRMTIEGRPSARRSAEEAGIPCPRAPYARPAAFRIRSAISWGWEMSDRWLAFTSIVVAPMRLAMNRSRSGLIVRSSVETA